MSTEATRSKRNWQRLPPWSTAPKVQTDRTQDTDVLGRILPHQRHETAILHDTDSDFITLFVGERFLQASITKIPLHSVTEIQITREWPGNTITIKSRILGETVVRFLNRTTSRRMYQAISNRLNNPTR